jgi:glycosyltransferase involved in cell wall biosynthesis
MLSCPTLSPEYRGEGETESYSLNLFNNQSRWVRRDEALRTFLKSMRRSLLIALNEDPSGPMSAPALRRFEIGRALADELEVRFAVPKLPQEPVDTAEAALLVVKGPKEFNRLLRSSDFLFALGVQPREFPLVARSGVRLILDLYVPRAFEVLESSPHLSDEVVRREHRRDVRWARALLRLADYLVCTNSYQRDFWLGMMIAMGRFDIADSRRSPNAAKLIDVVPHGLSDQPFEKQGSPLRSRLGLSEHDFVLLWSSKVLAWQDPITLMRAMQQVVHTAPQVKLVLLGTGPLPTNGHPARDGHEFRTREAVRCAAELGLLGTHVHFVEERIPVQQLGPYYRDCDAAIGTYPDSLETHYCLATRVLDYLNADLPVILSGTEPQADFIRQTGCGVLVPPADESALVEAILGMTEPERRERHVEQLRARRAELHWKRLVAPIRNYCRNAPETRRPPQDWLSICRDLGSFRHAHLRYRRALRRETSKETAQ